MLSRGSLSLYYTRVKICGIRKEADAVHAAMLGVDAIGLVFYEKSPRNISIKEAQAICSALPAFVTTVALVKDAENTFVEDIIDSVAIDCLQFHGSETPEYCSSFDRPYIKALGVEDAGDTIVSMAQQYPASRGILLDSHAPGEDGGTGASFDWNHIPAGIEQPLILAGGLKPDNVAEAIRTVRPYAVDISSGVEKTRGVKDQDLMTEFMKIVNQINGELNE